MARSYVKSDQMEHKAESVFLIVALQAEPCLEIPIVALIANLGNSVAFRGGVWAAEPFVKGASAEYQAPNWARA